MAKLTGWDAIEYARANKLTLHKYADPTEDAREHISVEAAEDVAREDANLVYLDSTTCIYCDRLPTHDPAEVPASGDDAAWARIAASGHAPDCEWVATRAHRMEA